MVRIGLAVVRSVLAMIASACTARGDATDDTTTSSSDTSTSSTDVTAAPTGGDVTGLEDASTNGDDSDGTETGSTTVAEDDSTGEAPPADRCPFPAEGEPDPCDDGNCFEMCGQPVLRLPPPALEGIGDVAGEPFRRRLPPIAYAGATRVREEGAYIVTRDADGTILGSMPRIGALLGATEDSVVLAATHWLAQSSYTIVDLADPGAPVAVATWSLPVTRGAWWEEIWRHAGYYAGSSQSRHVFATPGGVSWIDTTDPGNPVEVACMMEDPPVPQDWWYVAAISDDLIAIHRSGLGIPVLEVFAADDLVAPIAVLELYDEPAIAALGNRLVLSGDEIVLYELVPGAGLVDVDAIVDDAPTGQNGDLVGGFLAYGFSADYATEYSVDLTADDGLRRYVGPTTDAAIDVAACFIERYAVDGSEDHVVAPIWDPQMRWPIAQPPDLPCPAAVLSRPLGSSGARDPTADRIVVASDQNHLTRSGLDGSSPEQVLAMLPDPGGGIDSPMWVWTAAGVVVASNGNPLNQDHLTFIDVDAGSVTFEMLVPGFLFAIAEASDRLWVLGGAEGLELEDLPRGAEIHVLRWVDPFAPELGATEVPLPRGTQADTIVAMGERLVVLDSGNRLIVLEGDGVIAGSADVPSSLVPRDLAAGPAGAIGRDDHGRLWWMDPIELAVRPHEHECREWYPTAVADDDGWWFYANTPGGTTWTSRRELFSASPLATGDEFVLDVQRSLPVLAPRATPLSGDPAVVLDGRPIVLLP
jgi:hypothetical protein